MFIMHQLWRTWNIIVNKVEFCNFSILFRSMMVVKLANLVSLKMEVCRSAWILAFGQVAGRSLIICVIIYILCILYWKGAFILLTVGATQLTFSGHLVVWGAKTRPAYLDPVLCTWSDWGGQQQPWQDPVQNARVQKTSGHANWYETRTSSLEFVMTTKLNRSSFWPWKTSSETASRIALEPISFPTFCHTIYGPSWQWQLPFVTAVQPMQHNSSLLSNLYFAGNDHSSHVWWIFG